MWWQREWFEWFRLAPRTRIISSLAFRILLSRCALKSAAAAAVDKSTLDVDLRCVFRWLCQDACMSASVEYYNWACSFLTSFSRHVRAPIRQHHKVMMLQWPRRLRTVTSNQLWWSPRSCTDMQLWCDSPSNWLFFQQARIVWMGCPPHPHPAPLPPPLTQHFMIQYLLVWRVHADIPFDALYSSQHHCDAPPPLPLCTSGWLLHSKIFGKEGKWINTHLLMQSKLPENINSTQNQSRVVEGYYAESPNAVWPCSGQCSQQLLSKKATELSLFFFSPPFGPSEAGPMQQLPTRRDADVLLQLKEGITDSVITGIVEESSEWPIARWV